MRDNNVSPPDSATITKHRNENPKVRINVGGAVHEVNRKKELNILINPLCTGNVENICTKIKDKTWKVEPCKVPC